MCHRTGKYTVCRLVHASFIPEMLQGGAVEGLIGASQGSAMQASERKGEGEVWLVVGAWGGSAGWEEGGGEGF